MQTTNGILVQRYGKIAMFFHWIMAILLIALIVLGLYMTRLPISLLKLKLFGWHKELGMLALFLVILRLLWRLIHGNPPLPAYLARWEVVASLVVHWSFYILMFALPITGWVITSASGLPVSFFGLFLLPNLASPSEEMRVLFSAIHSWLAYALIIALCLHTAAALKHHFIDRDDILRRML